MRRIFRLFHYCLYSIYCHSQRNSHVLCLLSFLLLGFGLWGGGRVPVLVNVIDNLDSGAESSKSYRQLRQLFPLDRQIVLALAPKEGAAGWSNQEICELKIWSENFQRAFSEIEVSYSIFSLRKVEFERALSSDKIFYPKIIPDICLYPQLPWNSQFDNSSWKNYFSSTVTKDLLFAWNLKESAPKPPFGTFDYEGTARMIEALKEKFGARAVVTGGLPFQKAVADGMNQMNVVSLIGLVLLVAFLAFWFRSLLAVLPLVLSLAFTMVVLRGAIGFAGHSIDPLLSSLFLIVMLAVVEDYVFLVYQISSSKRILRTSFRFIAVPAFWTSFTTLVDLGSLTLSELPSISRFGLWSALGALLEWAALFCLMPAWMERWPFLKRCLSSVQPREAPALSLFRIPRLLAWSIVALVLLIPTALNGIDLSYNPLKTFPSTHWVSEGLSYLKKSRDWSTEVSVVFPKNSRIEKYEEVVDALKKDGAVAFVQGTHLFWEGTDLPHQYKDFIRRESAEQKDSRWLVNEDGTSRLVVSLKTADMEPLQLFRDRVEQLCKSECSLAGELIAYADLNEELMRTLNGSFMASMISVLLVLALLIWFKKSSQGFALALSVLIGPTLLLLTFWLGKISLDPTTCVGLVLSLGLTGDNAIHYLFGRPGKSLSDGVKKKGDASLVSAVLMSILCISFVFSDFATPRWLGFLLALSFFYSFFGDYLVLKSIIREEDPNANPKRS